ncbi:MAG: hypothetical protein OQL28_15930 [Sedimenticola sp.]|nr:hypothetical protein [Sedimenticola sp.]
MTNKMQRRALYMPVLHIDANLINARQKLETVNQLEKWADDGIICMNMSCTARTEARTGKNLNRIRKADAQIHTITPPAEAREPLYQEIEEAIFPDGAKNENQQNDIKIIIEAAKYAAILVTGDGGSKNQPGGMLGNRVKLKNILTILSPDEAVEFVRNKIEERDNFNKRVVDEIGGELPAWTGKD